MKPSNDVTLSSSRVLGSANDVTLSSSRVLGYIFPSPEVIYHFALSSLENEIFYFQSLNPLKNLLTYLSIYFTGLPSVNTATKFSPKNVNVSVIFFINYFCFNYSYFCKKKNQKFFKKFPKLESKVVGTLQVTRIVKSNLKVHLTSKNHFCDKWLADI